MTNGAEKRIQDIEPGVILVDTREQAPLKFGPQWRTELATLSIGDYGLKGFSDWDNPQFIIERKALGDLISSLTHGRERFWRELLKMRRYTFAAVVIEAIPGEIEMGEYQSAAKPQSILQSLAAIQVRMGVHIIWAGSHDGAARAIERLARQYLRGINKTAMRLNIQAQTTEAE